jgi:hypothetical protein
MPELGKKRTYSVEEDDAVCFSAGRTGAPFGAGAIHAYLASDRKPPLVAAGISLGALSAAVMERSYRDMYNCFDSGQPRTEAARWNWYRRYLSFLLDRPYDVVWDAIPNPSDLMADLPPVVDKNLPVDENGNTIKLAEEYEVKARRKLYIFARVGSWLGRVPIRFSSIAWLAVRYVRLREGYPDHLLLKIWNFVCLQTRLLVALWWLLLHLSRPFFVVEWHFKHDEKQVNDQWMPFRPLFGWLWVVALCFCLAAIGLALANVYFPLDEWINGNGFHSWHLLVLLVLLVIPILALNLVLLLGRLQPSGGGRFRRITQNLLSNLDFERSLLSDFPLLLKLFRLFEEKGHKSAKVHECKFPVLLVAAPLQILPSKQILSSKSNEETKVPSQLWARTTEVATSCEGSGQVSIVGALRACLAVTPWFTPWAMDKVTKNHEVAYWIRDPDKVNRLDLVDGSAVRHNPLPALFQFLKARGNEKLADSLQGKSVHLVYDVPIRWKPEPAEAPGDYNDSEPRQPNIVKTGSEGLRLARRRDSRYEVIRTNKLSITERTIREVTHKATDPAVLAVNVDEIAPEEELIPGNQLKPTETEMLRHIAAGCRQTLSVLYGEELMLDTDCATFLRRKAHLRLWNEVPSADLPGLPEVCRHCSRKLNPPARLPDRLLDASFRAGKKIERNGKRLSELFPALTGKDCNGNDRPRIVFLASGGVFRGSFHIGMLGAMLALNIKPDLIVGSSVGTLMGAALGSIFKAKQLNGDKAARKQLRLMVSLFVEVGDNIALTRSFKAATKDLGIRGRGPSLRLSPNQLRKMVSRGSRRDAGVAATGAPPALIDAISDLLLIPYNKTAEISAKFVAGHFSDAIHDFWEQIGAETIERLGIQNALLGANLIEREMRRLLVEDIPPSDHVDSALQPFLKDAGIAFFGTTVNLVTESITTLGSELNRRSYDMMEGLLASSAFPAAFAPRRASALYPGVGRRDIFYGDGGMFDNLPAMSAFEILSEVQSDRLDDALGQGNWRNELIGRHRHPDLFIVGSLNKEQTTRADKDPRDVRTEPINELWKRAKRLADNEKIYGLERTAQKVDRQLCQILPDCIEQDKHIDTGGEGTRERVLNGIVNAAILPVFPRDTEHLNGTFQFCKSLGLRKERVQRSIANGCFEMLVQIYKLQTHPESLPGRAIRGTRVPRLTPNGGRPDAGVCPYFQAGAGDIQCPFHGADDIHQVCMQDKTHQEHARKL